MKSINLSFLLWCKKEDIYPPCLDNCVSWFSRQVEEYKLCGTCSIGVGET